MRLPGCPGFVFERVEGGKAQHSKLLANRLAVSSFLFINDLH